MAIFHGAAHCNGCAQAAEARMPDGQSSVELRFNMGVAYSGLANVIKEMETRSWLALLPPPLLLH